jgi:hypothetical protein
MSNRTTQNHKIFARAGMCLIASAALLLPLTTPADGYPVMIRGIATAQPSMQLRLAYLATFPNGSLNSQVDFLRAGPMQLGDTLIPGSNPTFQPLPGEIRLGITRPADLSPDIVVAQSAWATRLNFGPGSVMRTEADFIAPVGPIPGGGFAIGLVAKIGGKDDLGDVETKVATTINVRPGFLVRLNVPFGSVEPTNMVLPQAARDAIFSTRNPQPFTLELTIDRTTGKGTSKLTVAGQVYSLGFTLSDFLANSGPTITAAGPGVAVNANGPGQTASVHVREFRIYTKVGG